MVDGVSPRAKDLLNTGCYDHQHTGSVENVGALHSLAQLRHQLPGSWMTVASSLVGVGISSLVGLWQLPEAT